MCNNRNDSADRNQDLQTLVDNWEQNKDLKNPVKLKIYGATITGRESILSDTKACHKKFGKKSIKSVSLPIPGTTCSLK